MKPEPPRPLPTDSHSQGLILLIAFAVTAMSLAAVTVYANMVLVRIAALLATP